jgi:hypothetical protein
VLDSASAGEGAVILGTNLTPAEQAAFDVLIRFFDGERDAERKALLLCSPFAAIAMRRIGTLSEEDVAGLVMETLLACVDHPEVTYLWGERRDTRRFNKRTQEINKVFL